MAHRAREALAAILEACEQDRDFERSLDAYEQFLIKGASPRNNRGVHEALVRVALTTNQPPDICMFFSLAKTLLATKIRPTMVELGWAAPQSGTFRVMHRGCFVEPPTHHSAFLPFSQMLACSLPAVLDVLKLFQDPSVTAFNGVVDRCLQVCP